MNKTFAVTVTYPNYDQSTDAIIGWRTHDEAYCGTLAKAVEVLTELGPSEWDLQYGIALKEGKVYRYFDWTTVNSYYEGPLTDPWGDAPF